MKKILFLVVVPALAATLTAQAQALPRMPKVASQFPSMSNARLESPPDENGNVQSSEQSNSINGKKQPSIPNNEIMNGQERKKPLSPVKP